jgi:ribosomal protein S20
MMMDNEPRMQDRSPEGQMFSIESEIKNMMKEYEMAVRDGDNQRAQMIADQIDRMQQKIIDLQGGIANKMLSNQLNSRGSSNLDRQILSEQMKGKDFFAEGGEAEMPEMSEQEAMAELEGIAPQAQMIEQLIMAVIQMIQQGVSEAEVREFLKEQGLDDEDIEDLFIMVMQQIEQAPAEEPIGRELQGIM